MAPAPISLGRDRGRHPFRKATARWRVRPDFLLLGAQKAGTTSLFAALCAHPGVLPGMAKEIHHFDKNLGAGLLAYRRNFPLGVQVAATGAIRRQPIRVGEATPEYLFDPAVPEAVARDLPDARFLVVLRDPVVRAFAHWRMTRSRGREDLSLIGAVLAEPERLDRAAALMVDDRSTAMRRRNEWSYFARGLYAEQLRRWYAHVDPSRVLVLRFDEMIADVDRQMDRVRAHLGLAPFELGSFPAENLGASESLDPMVEAELRERFASPNEELATLVGIDFNEVPEHVAGGSAR
jgi:hypothetical protein